MCCFERIHVHTHARSYTRPAVRSLCGHARVQSRTRWDGYLCPPDATRYDMEREGSKGCLECFTAATNDQEVPSGWTGGYDDDWLPNRSVTADVATRQQIAAVERPQPTVPVP